MSRRGGKRRFRSQVCGSRLPNARGFRGGEPLDFAVACGAWAIRLKRDQSSFPVSSIPSHAPAQGAE